MHNAWCCNFTINLLDWKERGEKEQSWLWRNWIINLPWGHHDLAQWSKLCSRTMAISQRSISNSLSPDKQSSDHFDACHQTTFVPDCFWKRRMIVDSLSCTNANIQRPLGKHKDCRLDPLISTVELQEPVRRVSAEGRFGRLPHHKCNWLTVQWAASWSTSNLCAINPMCCACEWSNAVALNVAFGASPRLCGSGPRGRVALFSGGRFVST